MARHNLCTNPSCTNNTTGWSGGAAPVRQTGLTGLPATTGARWSSGTFAQTATGSASPGLVYTGSLYVRPNGANMGSATFYLVFTRSAGGDDFGHTVATGSITNGTVTRVSLANVTAPANTTGVYLLWDGTNFGAIGSVDFTAVLTEQAAALDTWFDGGSPGASWDGTAGNSASTLADAGANPTGLAVALTPGTPTVALGLTAAPAGVASVIATGTPTVAIPTTAPAGVALVVALGTPSVTLNGAAPAGIAVPAAAGTPAAAIPAAGPAGVAAAAAAGQPNAAYTGSAAPAGIAVAVTTGAPRVGAGRPMVTRPNTGTVVRPNTGTVTRPNTGRVVRP